ncbi:uncharacterized protein LOC131234851 isoform X2 [Magnolia sinica]|uniref:uncharacterized protein LOC131234851 isoform X2 n=1 Tax=Magnolia sinica TaxID=86752 RepID=UPI002658F131|nr:uncharacterized protein LOC131234851 isoform X2 [Magnolia sinica]
MSGKNGNGDEKKDHAENVCKEPDSGRTSDDPKPEDRKGKGIISTSSGKEEGLKQRFGGLQFKFPPIRTKIRSYFDSADWEKDKVGGAGLIDLLPPKLQPSPPSQPLGESPLSQKSAHESPTEREGDASLDDATHPNPSQ